MSNERLASSQALGGGTGAGDPIYPRIRLFTVRICEGCLSSDGEMCNTPECVFCWHTTKDINTALDLLLIRPVIDGERLVGDEGELEHTS